MRTNVSVCRRRAIGAAIAAAAVCLGVAACGSSAPTGTAEDPATVAPASSIVYVSAVVRPEGSLRQTTVADAKLLSHRNEPLGDLLHALAGSTPLGEASYATEIKPWLGRNAGMFATTSSAIAAATQAIERVPTEGFSPEQLLRATSAGLLTAKGSAAAVVLDTSDLGRARTFIAKLAHRESANPTQYRGATFDRSADGNAVGIVGKFVVVGNEAGLKAAIDTHLGEPSLKDEAHSYARLAAKRPIGALATVYLNLAAGTSATGDSSAQQIPLLEALSSELKQALISIVPEHLATTIDLDALGSNEAKVVSSSAAAANLVQTLPEGTSIGVGVGEGGTRAARYLSLVGSVVSLESKSLLEHFGGPSLTSLLSRLDRHPQALQSLLAERNGPAMAFIYGTTLFSLGAGVELESSAPAPARATIAKLGALLAAAGAHVTPTSIFNAESAITIRVPGLPVILDAGADSRRLVIGLGPETVLRALGPTEPKAPHGLYAQAVSKLGGAKPVVLANFPNLVTMFNSLGLNESPTVGPVVASLHSLELVAGAVQGLGAGIVRLHVYMQLGVNFTR
ncbi:MAG: DUF3352 domain-containing protein [Solirubrobacteraceae bacterium]